jgi:hypothetical protein
MPRYPGGASCEDRLTIVKAPKHQLYAGFALKAQNVVHHLSTSEPAWWIDLIFASFYRILVISSRS